MAGRAYLARSSGPVPPDSTSSWPVHDAGAVAPPTEIHEEMRRLIGRLGELAAGRPDAPSDLDSALLDVELDGIRCILTRTAPAPARAVGALSPREQEIVRMVAAGYPNKVIAGVLDISAWTVCTHLRRIFAKLQVTSRAAMIAKLFDDGFMKSGRPR